MKRSFNLSSFWGRVAGSALSELVVLFGNKIHLPEVLPLRQVPKGTKGTKGKKVRDKYEPRDRIFNQWRTFWLSLAQVLSQEQTCNAALKKA